MAAVPFGRHSGCPDAGWPQSTFEVACFTYSCICFCIRQSCQTFSLLWSGATIFNCLNLTHLYLVWYKEVLFLFIVTYTIRSIKCDRHKHKSWQFIAQVWKHSLPVYPPVTSAQFRVVKNQWTYGLHPNLRWWNAWYCRVEEEFALLKDHYRIIIQWKIKYAYQLTRTPLVAFTIFSADPLPK